MAQLLFTLFTLYQIASAVTIKYNVDCAGACPSAYRLTKTAPTAAAPANNQNIVCALGDVVVFSLTDAASIANHPFHIKTARGAGGPAYSSANPNTPSSTARDVTVNCDSSLCAVNSGTVFYQCTIHGSMGGAISVSNCPAAPQAPTAPVPVAPPKAAPPTICSKYANALTGGNQTALMETIVGAVVQAEVANPKVKIFFDGTQPPNSTNFLLGGRPLAGLSFGLVTFFGAALGCNQAGFPKYTGPADMKALHQPMGIGRTELDLFNDIFINVLAGLKVEAADLVTVRSFLDSFIPAIVNPNVICNKYVKATGLNQTALMNFIVGKVVGNLLANPTMKKFFDGTLPAGSTNFTAGGAQGAKDFARLAGHLVQFFGAALGCSDPTFPKYDGNPNMRTVHANMPIGGPEFKLFNDIFITTLNEIGVDAGDQKTVRIILDSFNTQIVNPQLICPKYATALKVTQLELMTTIVNAVVAKELGDPVVKQFFDGTLPKGSINFTSPSQSANFNRLAGGLISFFGAALGCKERGFPAYTGITDMREVHKAMPINKDVFTRFNNAFVAALNDLKVDPADVSTVLAILNSFSNQIINPTYICKKYSTALGVSQVDLMTTIVSAVVTAELKEPSLKVYFDGTKPPGSTDFTKSTTDFNRLANGLVTFFGAALGCTDPSKKRFPAYLGNPDMKAVHANMNITKAEFDKFNQIFITTLAGLGVDQADQALVLATLNTFSGAIVASNMPPAGADIPQDLKDRGFAFYQPLDCGIALYWKTLDPLVPSVSFALRRQTDGFIALGFPRNNSFMMVGSDAVIGWVSSGSASVNAYSLNAKFASDIVIQPNFGLTDTSADETNGVTTIYFTRPFAAGNNPITDVEKVTVIASTLDGFDGLRYHSCRVNQAFVLNLKTGNGTAGAGNLPNPKKDAHGALMMTGWGIFFVLGLLVAGYGREAFSNGLWFKLHQFFQTVGLILTTTGFIISWFMVDGVFFNTDFHAQLGTAIMGVVYFQYLSGVFRPHLKEDQEKSAARKVFEILHPWTGRLLCIAATVNIFAGISIWWPFWVHIIYAIIVATFTVVAVIGEFIRQTKGKGGDDQSYHQMT